MNPNLQDTIVLFGDSLTQMGWDSDGFVQRLAAAYVTKLDVINRGYNGYTSEWAIPIFEQIFAKKEAQQYLPKIQLLAIWLGANDAAVPTQVYPHTVSLPKFISNMTRLINMVKSPSSPYYSESTRLILITPPPVDNDQRADWVRSNQDSPWALDRDFDNVRKYADAVKEIGIKERVPVVDVWTSLWEAAGKYERAVGKYLTDGLHFNADGYAIVYECLMKTIADNYPEILPDNLQSVFTEWDVLSSSNTPKELLGKRDVFALR